MDELLDRLEDQNTLVESKMNKFAGIKDTYAKESAYNELDKLVKAFKNTLDEARSTFESLSSGDQPQYNSKLKTFSSEYDIKKIRFNKIQEGYLKQERLNKLKQGQLSGRERIQAERDYAVDLHKETDLQGDIINDIGKDIRGANENLGQIAVAVDEQGKQINRIHGTVLEGQATVRATDKNAQKMISRAKCTKALLWITNVFIFLAIIAIIVIKATNHYRCTHQK